MSAVEDAFWIILGREPNAVELAEIGDSPSPDALASRLLSSPEFRLLATCWKDGRPTGRAADVQERGLRALGSDEQFLALAYRLLQGREPDAGGRDYFLAALRAGLSRTDAIRTMVLSDEFQRRYWRIAPDAGVVPRDVQLCELANPAKWDNPEWMALLRDLQVVPDHKLAMHRKSYEFTQLLYTLTRLGRIDDATTVVSVGAGHECVLYWLANHAGRVVATDRYEGVWQTVGAREGDARVLEAPERYAPFPYRRERLAFERMDARRLRFDSGSVDVAYSLSSIEHVGGFAGAREAIAEMARIVKRGGLVILATEYILSGPPHPEAFQPADIHALLDRPDLRLLQPIDETVYQRYECAVVDLSTNPHQTPHMVVRLGDTVFTSVFAVLEKA